MDTETDSVQETQEQAQDTQQPENQGVVGEEQAKNEIKENVQEETSEQKNVPLSALLEERRKRQDEAFGRQEAEKKNRWLEDMQAKKLQNEQDQALEDEKYEAVTKEDLKNSEIKTIRAAEENFWKRSNPKKIRDLNENLKEFLTERPHLTAAIENAPNRYDEAWNIMSALMRKEKFISMPPTNVDKKPSPGSPSAVPKATGTNQSLDVMQMNDSEFSEWTKSKRGKR